jgi:hypothetical protein
MEKTLSMKWAGILGVLNIVISTILCPRCGRPMTKISQSASQPGGRTDTFVYTCVMHGQFEILPNGRVLPKPETFH